MSLAEAGRLAPEAGLVFLDVGTQPFDDFLLRFFVKALPHDGLEVALKAEGPLTRRALFQMALDPSLLEPSDLVIKVEVDVRHGIFAVVLTHLPPPVLR